MKRLLLIFGTTVALLPWLAGARVQAGPIGWSIFSGYVEENGSTVLESRNYGLNGTIELEPLTE